MHQEQKEEASSRPSGRHEGLLKACKYSYITNKMEYCGSKEANAHFTGYIASQTEENRQKAETAFPSFESLWPYLNLIAKANSLEPLDGQVVEAYWLGNSLLEKAGMDDLKKVILTA